MRKDFIILILLLAFTTFEFFFRAELLSWILYFFAGIIYLTNQKVYGKKIFNGVIILCLSTLLSCYLVQVIFLKHFYFSSFITRSITLIGTLLVAAVIEKRAVSIFVKVMYWISIYSTCIYVLCFIPGVYDILFNSITPYFTSLNVSNAVFDGGGSNFIIYNFSSGSTLSDLGIHRNSGPFWEPGQFGVYICIALFFNLFIEKQNLRLVNPILILALVTTCSTGAYVGGFVIFAVYAIFKSRNMFITILYLIVILLLWQQVSGLEFLSEKISSQIENTEIGNDLSRFSAFLTQVEMIKNSPLIGGEQISEYVNNGSTTLASGTLLPFVILGIPFGLVYLIFLYISCNGLCSSVNRPHIGTAFFILLLILSFSQTILMVPMIMTLMFVGLIKIAKKHKLI